LEKRTSFAFPYGDTSFLIDVPQIRHPWGGTMSLFSTAGLARASAHRPWTVISVWVVVFALAIVSIATGLSDALTTQAEFLSKPESIKGFDLLDERMNFKEPITETIVVHSDSLTVDDAEFQQVVQNTANEVRGLSGMVDPDPAKTFTYYEAAQAPGGADAANGLVSDDRHSTIIPVTLLGDVDTIEDDLEPRTDEYLDAVSSEETDAISVSSVGTLSINDEFNTTVEEDLATAEVIGIPAALLILIVVFGALVAAILPITLAIVSIIVALGTTALVGQFWDLSFFITNMITMIGLAVGIDYALFIVSRYREERRRGRPKYEAIETAGGTASKAVLFSGMAVTFGLLGLFLLPFTIFRSLGLGAVLVVVSAVAAMLTLVPALLGLLGDRINWPRRIKYDAAAVEEQYKFDHETIHRGFWGRFARTVMARPVIGLVIGTLLLIVLAIPYFDLNTGFAGVETLPNGDAKSAFTILEEDFSAGRLAPLDIVIDGERTPEIDQAMANFNAAAAANPELGQVAPAQWNEANNLALIRVTLGVPPNDQRAYDLVDELRDTIIPQSFAGSDADDVLVSGETAFNADFFSLVDEWTPVVFAFVLGLSFILLMLAFRSIVVPAKAIVMNLLSVGAAYGLLVLVFQKGYGADFFGFQTAPTIEAWLPIFLFCVLFGLSMDYHVFLLSRIREHYDLTHNNRESVAVGLQSTGRIITGAALIMVVVFAGFAAGSLVMLEQVGFGLAVAVLIDATLVRTILVPSAMVLLGDRNWYLPKWLYWIPDLRVEGRPAHVPAPVAEPSAAD
jgi:putative drug exporter of the RND superfamily